MQIILISEFTFKFTMMKLLSADVESYPHCSDPVTAASLKSGLSVCEIHSFSELSKKERERI